MTYIHSIKRVAEFRNVIRSEGIDELARHRRSVLQYILFNTGCHVVDLNSDSTCVVGRDCDGSHYIIIAFDKNIIARSELCGIAGKSTKHNERKKERDKPMILGDIVAQRAHFIDEANTELSVEDHQTRILFKIGLEGLIASSGQNSRIRGYYYQNVYGL